MKDFFVEDILEKFEDYTQPVDQGPSFMNQEPRNMYVAGGVIKAAKKLLTQTPKPKPSILRREAVPLNLTQINEISKNKEFEQAWKNYKISIRKVGRRKYSKDQFFEIWARENMAQGGRIGLVDGGLLTTGPNTGKYVLRNRIDNSRKSRYFDTKELFDAAVKESQTKPKGGKRGDYTKQISKPTAAEIETAETVYGKKYNKTGNELWQSLRRSERGGIRQKTTTGGKKGPKEGLAVNPEGKPKHYVKRQKSLKRNAPFFQKGTKDFQFHHIMNIGGEIPLDTNDIAVISGEMNRALAPDNRKLNNIADNISDLLNDQPENYLKKIDQLNSEGESIVKTAIKKLPKEYKNLIGFNKVVPITDEYGTLIDISSQKIGGSNQKKPGIKLENLTTQQASELRKQIKSNSKLNPKQEKMIKNLFCGNKKGGQPGTCDISEALDNMVRETNAVKNGQIKGAAANNVLKKAGKVARFGTGTGLGAVLGPWGIAGEAAFEIAMAVPGYGKGKSGKRILGDSLLGLIPGVGQSSEEEFTEYATKDGMQDFEQQQIKDANRFLELNNSLGQLQNAGALEGKGSGRGNVGRAENLFFKQMDEYTPLYNQFVGAPPSESVSTVISEQDRINRQIAEAEAIRAQKRNIAGEEDFMAAEGGLANLMKKYYD